MKLRVLKSYWNKSIVGNIVKHKDIKVYPHGIFITHKSGRTLCQWEWFYSYDEVEVIFKRKKRRYKHR